MMRILISNDDSYTSKGIRELVEIMRPYGDIKVVAPKYHQSGTSMAVDLGFKPVAVKKFAEEPGVEWWYVDGAPASCVKYGLDVLYADGLPDAVVSGINHGSNAATATLYSATVGATKEGALAGIPSFAVSLNTFNLNADFSCVRMYFPQIFETIMSAPERDKGIYYNINFPDLPAEQIKGIKVCRQGNIKWVNEFGNFDPDIYGKLGVRPIDLGVRFFPEVEEGERVYAMVGDIEEVPGNDEFCDHRAMCDGWVAVSPQKIDMTDFMEIQRLERLGLNKIFR